MANWDSWGIGYSLPMDQEKSWSKRCKTERAKENWRKNWEVTGQRSVGVKTKIMLGLTHLLRRYRRGIEGVVLTLRP